MKINKLPPEEFPDRLKQLAKPPKQLFVAGELEPLLSTPSVAIVGSRKVSQYGRQVTERLASELASNDVTIISGLALGVDSIAHKACLEAEGKTIAVLPTPLEQVYPAAHRQLARDIINHNGAIVSEYGNDDFVGRINFIARNRIVAALADAILITEAALKSGSLHTANYALELGRDVLVVPGNITSPTSEGCNNLLKHGATPVTSVEDILFVLGITADKAAKTKKVVGSNASEQAILGLLSSGISDGHELLAKSKLAVSEFNQTLTMLELNGRVRPVGSNHWTLV